MGTHKCEWKVYRHDTIPILIITIAELFAYNASGRFWPPRKRNVLIVVGNLIGWICKCVELFWLEFSAELESGTHVLFLKEKNNFCMSSFINWKPNLITNCRFIFYFSFSNDIPYGICMVNNCTLVTCTKLQWKYVQYYLHKK